MQAIINKLWFGYDLEHAISAPVMHTQGDSVLFEDSFSKVSGLGGEQVAPVTLLGNLYFASGSSHSCLNLNFSTRLHTHILLFHTWQCGDLRPCPIHSISSSLPPQEVRTGLLGRGHKEKKDKFAMNVVQGISKEGKCISAYSDKRKLGKSAGY